MDKPEDSINSVELEWWQTFDGIIEVFTAIVAENEELKAEVNKLKQQCDGKKTLHTNN